MAFWLIQPPKDYPTDRFCVHDITVKVTTIVLEQVGASVLLADKRTACLAAGAALEGRTIEGLFAEVVAVLKEEQCHLCRAPHGDGCGDAQTIS